MSKRVHSGSCAAWEGRVDVLRAGVDGAAGQGQAGRERQVDLAAEIELGARRERRDPAVGQAALRLGQHGVQEHGAADHPEAFRAPPRRS